MKTNPPEVDFILLERNHHPGPLLEYIRLKGDDSFVQRFSVKEFGHLLPELPDGFQLSKQSAICLALETVEEHDDSQVGELHNSGTLLGFVDVDPGTNATLHANAQTHQVQAGDWVIFDDKVPHRLDVTGAGRVYAVSIQVFKQGSLV